VTCPVCDASDVGFHLRTHGVDIQACATCGLQFWEPPDEFRPEATYDAEYFDGAHAAHGYDDYASLESSLRRNFARRLRRLGPPAPGARLLDVGAAYGYAVSEARRAGWSAAGLEVSVAAARQAGRTEPGHVVAADVARAPFAPASFDVVTLWDVIEHLPDPHGVLDVLVRLLRPGGRLVLSTGDVGSLAARISGARWHLYTLPEHLFFYTRRSLALLLELHGFRVEWMRAEASMYTVGYLVERLRKTLLGRTGSTSPDWPGAALEVPVNLFDVVTVSAIRVAD
jgi:SAM-dependent methyltransferase